MEGKQITALKKSERTGYLAHLLQSQDIAETLQSQQLESCIMGHEEQRSPRYTISE